MHHSPDAASASAFLPSTLNAPTRILYVVDQMLGPAGAEQSIVRILQHLPRNRFQPYLLTFRFNPQNFPPFPCPVLVYPFQRIYSPTAFRYIWPFHRFLRRERIDLVHTFFESSDIWAGPIARLSGNIGLISSRRDLGVQRSRLQNFAYPLVSRLFDQVQAVAEEVRTFVMQADRIGPERVVTIPNAIDTGRIPKPQPRQQVLSHYGLTGQEKVVVCVGNVRRLKGYDVMVKAARTVCSQMPEVRFLVAGWVMEQDHQQQLEAEIAQAGLQDRVLFLGKVDHVFPLLLSSDVFFLPSFSEGMSNALLEAMACRLPAVATRVGGNLDLVQENQTGLLIEVGDHAGAAQALLRLLRDGELASAMGQAARRRIEQEYSVEAVMHRMMDEYDRILARRRIRPRRAS